MAAIGWLSIDGYLSGTLLEQECWASKAFTEQCRMSKDYKTHPVNVIFHHIFTVGE
jgi:hypothetical protein